MTLLALARAIGAVAAPVDWPTVQVVPIAQVSAPTTITHAGDGSGRLFVTEQSGRIRIIKGTNLLAEPFLTITNRVLTGPERGLLGLAFPPAFSQAFYVNYTRVPDGATVVSRFQVSPTNSDLADAASEQMLLVIPQPYENHNGGCIAFGPDGYLYVGMGDGGSGGDPENRAQNKQSLLGKILRLDVSGGGNGYAIPPTNPFRTNVTYHPEIWALGLRNPWRFSFDRVTGDLYIADVGQYYREEVNFQPASSRGGENYGWRAVEGKMDYNLPSGFPVREVTLPVWDYGPGPGAAIIGGCVYRGTRFPRMKGLYFYSDWGLPGLPALKFEDGQWQHGKVSSASGGARTFGEDEEGEIYLGRGNEIVHLVDTNGCYPPVFESTEAYHTSVRVNCLTPNARLHFTSESRDPGETDPSVGPGETVPVNPPQTIRVRAFRAGLQASATIEQTFDAFRVAPPTFEPRSGPGRTLAVTIKSLTPGASIYYTTNGAGPTPGDMAYTQPFLIQPGTPIYASAFRAGYIESAAVEMRWALLTSVEATNGSLAVTVQRGSPFSLLRLESSTDLKVWRTHFEQNGGSEFTTFYYTGYSSNQPGPQFFRALQYFGFPSPEP
jgi:glucose/arabinose dehydrogenase